MADAKDKRYGAPYSGTNKIPNIKQFVERLDKDKADRDKQLDDAARNGGPKPHVETVAGKKGTRRVVHDPTTGKDVEIEDVDAKHLDFVKNPTLSVPNANLEGKDVPLQTKSSQSGEDYRKTQDVTAPPDPIHPNSTSDVPIHGEKTNILFHPTPSVSYEPMFEKLEKRAWIVMAGVFFSIVVFGRIFGGALFGLIPTGACVATGVWFWMKEVVRSGREVEWSSEQERGDHATQNLIPESVEWMNTLTAIIWGLINPEMFAAVADTLEDVMQASLPGIIENVRVADISQGSNPLRILSMRALPDASVKDLKDAIRAENMKTKDPQEVAADEEGGDYYNMECAFAYHAAPSGSGIESKARNMHLNLVFYLGVKGFFGVPFPIWVELQGLVGTIRLRMQMTPEPPFLKTLTFTLMGIPQVSVGCIPMFKTGINILNLPLISNFVNYAIGAAASMYVAPKCMTLDIGKMLQGDDITKDTESLGVILIKIHRAEGLSKQDRRGSKDGGSDPYITLSFSKYGKPMYCTRVIQDDLNPIWEEHAGILLKADYIKADENLSVELWDSDRMSADDVVGKIELSLQDMLKSPGTMFPQESKLRGLKADSEMPGVLFWEVGYFEKPHFRRSLRTSGENVNVADHLKGKDEFQDDKGVLENEEEDAVAHTPPDPLWPSGILSVIVHQIVGLELENIKGTQGGRRKGKEYEPGKDADEVNEEEGKNLPSSYCQIHLNDALVYRTRVKVVSSQPIFNAGTERFVRDWRSAIVTVTARDQRMRQHDPILGVIPLRLADILQTASQVTRWYPLDGGIGFGRARISLLFRSVETRLPPNLLGWDVGTAEFLSKKMEAVGYNKTASVKVHTGGSSGKFGKDICESSVHGASWTTHQKDGTPIRFPVKYRYRSPLVFEFTPRGSRKPDAYATLWLQNLVDNEETDIDIPIWATKNPARLLHNYVTDENVKSVSGLDDIKELGRLRFKGRFKAGMDEDHAHFVTDNNSRETQEMWDACRAEGVRDTQASGELPESVRKLHEDALIKERDVLREMDPTEREKFLSKDGTDWTQAFGDDPAAIADEYLRRKTQRAGTTEGKGADPFEDDDDDDDEEDNSSDEDDVSAHGQTPIHPKSTIEEDRKPQSGTVENANPEADLSVHNGKNGINGDKKGPFKEYRENRDGLHRKERGIMQWRPARNFRFAKNEAKFALKGLKNKLALDGREPDVETEA